MIAYFVIILAAHAFLIMMVSLLPIMIHVAWRITVSIKLTQNDITCLAYPSFQNYEN